MSKLHRNKNQERAKKGKADKMKRAQLGESKSQKSNERARHLEREGRQAARLKSISVDRIKECKAGWSLN